ncbi:MAG: energy-coupling factor transporter ATPase [Lachnospiraceae bacterium]|nr:energy-coupling factor transporter ATPase [Lachnospiraceae bacterium]
MDIIRTENLISRFVDTDDEGREIVSEKVLDGVNISAKQGEFIAILGHNGSGKSTFAKHLNALLYPTEGTVLVNGKDTAAEEELWDIRQTVGMIFQNPDNQIIGNIVEEDIGFGPENMGLKCEDIWERVNQAIQLVDMEKHRYKSPHSLSGGQKQRVAIAGILAMKPKCMVMDEPTAMLDPVGRKEVLSTVLELNKKENVTIILITHHMEEVINADRVFVMNEGKVVMEGTPREIFVQVEKMKGYHLDVPQATEIAYRLKLKGIDIREDILTMDELAEEIAALKR